MEDYTEFLEFDILGDSVNVLYTDTVYGTNIVAEIIPKGSDGKSIQYELGQEQIHYMGLAHERLVDEHVNNFNPALAIAYFAWEEYTGRSLSDADLIKVAEDNASVESYS